MRPCRFGEHVMHKECDSYQDEVMKEILEEADEYVDNWQRSEEEGWFYSDE